MSRELPEGWGEATGNDVFEFVTSGSRGWAKFYSDSGPLFVRIGNLDHGTIWLDLSSLQHVSPPDGAEGERTRLRAGDILVSITAELGMVGLVPSDLGEAYINQHIALCRPSSANDPEFVAWYLSAPGKKLLNDARRGATKAGPGLEDIRDVPIPLPPLNEQKRIVAKIDALTEKSREARQALDEVPALLDQLRQSILAAAFRGDLTKKWREQNPNVEPASVLLERIRQERRRKWEESELAKFRAKGKLPPDDKWKSKYVEPAPVDTEGLPELPEGWCWSSLDELTLMSGGITKGQKRKGNVPTRPVPYLRVANVQRGSLKLDEVSEIEATEDEIAQLRLLPGDILLNEGGDIDKLGRGWIWEGQIDLCIHQNHVFRARPASDELTPEFISHFTNTFGQRYFLNTGKQTTNLASVSMTRVKACPVPLASATEMREIASMTSDALELTNSLLHERAALSDYLAMLDSSILAKAFRGELVAQDPNDEPASVLLERIRKEREGGAPKKSRKAKG